MRWSGRSTGATAPRPSSPSGHLLPNRPKRRDPRDLVALAAVDRDLDAGSRRVGAHGILLRAPRALQRSDLLPEGPLLPTEFGEVDVELRRVLRTEVAAQAQRQVARGRADN